jgi:hypothetical protein
MNLLIQAEREAASLRAVEWFSIFVTVLALLNSIVLFWRHAVANKHPLLQKYTLRILLIVPVYSITSSLSLWLHGRKAVVDFFEILRRLVDASAIFSFVQYIMVAAGGAKALAFKFAPEAAEAKANVATGAIRDIPGAWVQTSSSASPPKRVVRQFPLLAWFLPRWPSASHMIRWCVRGTLSYAVVSGTVAIIKLLLFLARLVNHWQPVPGHSVLNEAFGHLLLVVQCLAMASLITLGINMLQDIHHIRPEAKFFSVKMVVFFTTWQGLLLHFLAWKGCLAGLTNFDSSWWGWDQATVATGLQNLLTCIEMCILSICYFWVWPADEYLKVLAHLHTEQDSLPSGTMPDDITRTTSDVTNCKRAAAKSMANFNDVFLTLKDVSNIEFKPTPPESIGDAADLAA